MTDEKVIKIDNGHDSCKFVFPVSLRIQYRGDLDL